MSQKQSLQHLIESQILSKEGYIFPNFDTNRFSRIITKLAIGHAGYEYDDLNFEGANGLWYDFLPNISDEKKRNFKVQS